MAKPTDILITAVTSDGATPTIAENSANATTIGTLGVVDSDVTTYTYSLLDSAGGRFSISGNTLRVNNSLLLDYETQLDHTITIRVTESGQTFDKSFVIRLTDVQHEIITGSSSADTLTGGGGNDSFSGAAGADLLTTDAGNDTLDGGTGADTMFGGTGNDIYYVDNTGDVVQDATLAAASGHDKIYSSIDFDLSNIVSFVIDGSTVKYSAATIEDLTLTDSALNATGNSVSNVIAGNANANRIDGKVGSDTMAGGSGNDTYVVDNAGDIVEESAAGGADTVEAWVTYSLTPGSGENAREVENLILSNSALVKNFHGTGNDLDNTITGNDGANIIDGKGGADTMTGGNGSDTYYVDHVDDSVREDLSTGGTNDQVFTAVSFALGANIEKLTLLGTLAITGTGNTQANTITGNDAANIIDGGTGKDTMAGGEGDDTYLLDLSNETVNEIVGEGNDTIRFAGTLSLNDFLNVENLELLGTGASNATGNTLDNRLTGTIGANALDGGTGNDTMIGYAGDDTYIVDSLSDVVTEATNAGTDLVVASVSYVLSADLENLTLALATNINATGNTGANILTGNDGNNVIDGGTGADTMDGKAGDDVYLVDSLADVVIELDGKGKDTIRTALSYNLSTNTGLNGTGFVENLTLLGSAVAASGNALNNVITGNASGNTIDGGAGIDTMAGGLGDDTYTVDNIADIVSEAASAGTDTIFSSVSYSLVPLALQPTRAVENLYLTGTAVTNATGNALNNKLGGNAAANKLNGGFGADTMEGGAGNDTYYVDHTGDKVTELVGEGVDTIISSGTISIDLTSLANIEHATIAGTAASVVGNANNNTLTGNASANIIDGGIGADLMAGGAGNDTYYVDSASDVVKENFSAGMDEIQSSVSYTLSAYVEKLVLTGALATSGTGNTIANVLVGNGAANLLDGKIGADTMIGGTGDDTYVVDVTGDIVDETGGSGTDLVRSTISYTLGSGLEHLTLTAAGAINGTGNGNNNRITGGAGANLLDGGTGVDTLAGGAGNDTYVIDTTTDVITELAGAGIDLIRSSVTLSLGTINNVEQLTLTGVSNINATGNNLANALTGNAGNNVLSGGIGGDTISGGLGNDTLTGGSDNDVFVFNTTLNGTTNVDQITDFNAASDQINLARSAFSTLGIAGALNATAFHTGTAAAGLSDRIIYNSATGALFYDADGTGATAMVKFATLATGLALDADNFVII